MDETRLSLLQRLRSPGDQSAWGEFVRIYEPLLIGFARKKNVPEHDIADLVQTIYIALLRALPTFRLDHDRGRFRSWLYQVTMNAVIDRGRRQQRHARREVGMNDQTPEPAAIDASPDADWDRAYHERMFQLALEQVRERTVETTWRCFERFVLAGHTSEEVAVELNMQPNTVRKNAARVLQRVREQAQANIGEMEA